MCIFLPCLSRYLECFAHLNDERVEHNSNPRIANILQYHDRTGLDTSGSRDSCFALRLNSISI